MKYILRINVLGNVPEIEISESEYCALQMARNTLSHALEIEEKYEILISNYLDFEQEILNATTEYMIRAHLDYSDFFKGRLGFNIKLVNLLTPPVSEFVSQNGGCITLHGMMNNGKATEGARRATGVALRWSSRRSMP